MAHHKIYRIEKRFLFNPMENTINDLHAAKVIGRWPLVIGSHRQKPWANSQKPNVQSIEPMLSALIVHLIERSPEPATQAELISKFWGPTIKGEEALMKTVSKVRKLFPIEVIKTISKVGYQWTASVVAEEPKSHAGIAGVPIFHKLSPRKFSLSKLSLSKLSVANMFFILALLMILKSIIFPHPH